MTTLLQTHTDPDTGSHAYESMNTTLAIGTIFKNESHILQEWIEHYIKEGVDRFYLIDNGSTDNYEEAISRVNQQISSGSLAFSPPGVVSKPRRIEIKVFKDSRRYMQAALYNRYLKNIKADWLIIADLDEFIYSRLQYPTIKEYLQSLPNDVSQVHVIWKLFGSNYYIFQPPRVVPFFLYLSGVRSKLYKSILRVSRIKEIGIHYSVVTGRNVYCCWNEDTGDNFTDAAIVSKRGYGDLKYHYLHLNHYQVQSWEFFSKVKMTRGDAYSKINDNIRDELYYELQDKNTVFDDELKRKHYPLS
jgi:glycosyltransferase involved in cell wall biosynthesis